MQKTLQSIVLLVFVFFAHMGWSQHVVISEVYGGGGNSGATYKNDFIELYNPTSSSVSLTGWSVQYTSATGATWQVTNLSGSIAAHGYYLIQEAVGSGGTTSLPTPDATGTIAMSATTGKVALVQSTTALNSSCSGYVDLIGFGPTANCSEVSPAPVLTNTTSAERKANASSTATSMSAGGADEFLGNGYDSDNNSTDFITRSPQPQNSASPYEPDTTPPSFTFGYPQTANVTESQTDIVVNMSEPGTAYYVVLAQGATAPSAAQVKAGQNSDGDAVTNGGSFTVATASTDANKTITGLTPGTSYDIYVVVSDAASNLQANATDVAVTTVASDDPTLSPSTASITFPGFTALTKQSAAQTFTLSANHLTDDVSISVSDNFVVSSDDANYSSSITVGQNDFTNPVTIYVKFNAPQTTGTQTGTITISSDGATSKLTNVSAVAIDPLNQNFNDPAFLTNSGWTQYSRLGAQVWASTNFGHTCLTGCTNATADKAAQINGFASSAVANEDWLISPLLDLTTFSNFPSLSFWTISAFAGDKLQLKYSADYAGSGDPALATWTSIDGKFPESNSSVWTNSPNIILPKSAIYVAFVYTSSSSAASRWTVDDWQITDIASYIDVPTIYFSYGEVLAGSQSTAQSFSFSAIGYGDITVSVPNGYEVSLDNTSFASSQVIASADAEEGKTVYVRFAPAVSQLTWDATVTFTGTGLNESYGILKGSSYPKANTFNIATYNLEFFASNVKDATGAEFGPTDDALQLANVTTVMQTIGADIFGVEEISNDTAFAQLVTNLPGYDKVESDRWSYSFEAPDPHYPPQKTGFIFNTSKVQLVSSRVMFADMYDSLLAGTRSLPSYPTGDATSFWSSGRLPFMATFDVTVRGVTKRIRMIDIHGKASSDQTSHDRRLYDATVLRDTLNTYYAHDNIILVGDFNDDVYGSITTGADSPYKQFVDDNTNFKVLTYALNQSGATSYPSFGGLIDNMIISNELVASYLDNSVAIEDPRNYISNYSNTTSDHLPVTARFLLMADQTITFATIADKKVTDNTFTLTASTEAGLPITFTTTSDKVTISGNQVTIVKAGRVTITASQAGDDTHNAAASVDQSFCIIPATPTITMTDANTPTPTLTSSATDGNSWFMNGTVIPDAVNSTLKVQKAAVYKVQVTVDDCVSAFSADAAVITTGDKPFDNTNITLYPNPASDYLFIASLPAGTSQVQLTDMTGDTSTLLLEELGSGHRASVQELSSGLYILHFSQGGTLQSFKFVKK